MGPAARISSSLLPSWTKALRDNVITGRGEEGMASYESVQLEEEARQKREVHEEEGGFQMVYNCTRQI